MIQFKLSTFQRRCIGTVFFFTAALRFISLGCYPLADTTEARYAEIARLMVKTGNWITPQISKGVPFWGKPPLSTWLSALSMKVFGFNEMAARLPSFVLACAIILLVWHLAARQRGNDYALTAATILLTSALFLVSSGAVMTDPALFLGTTLSMVAFWQALHTEGYRSQFWGYFFFVGIAIGLLAKGPVAVVMIGMPLGLWVVWQNKWQAVWQNLPWIGGLIALIMLAVPWYWLAEIKTPGFLHYFIIGEHWQRFTVAAWKGDLYGHVHDKMRGTIWLYWLAATCPWSLAFFCSLISKKNRRHFKKHLSPQSSWISYLLLWTISPMLFFTIARNILWTYVLPGLPAFALLITEFWFTQTRPFLSQNSRKMTLPRFIPWTAAAMNLLLFLALILITMKLVPTVKCQKELFLTYQRSREQDKGQLIYLYNQPYSARFYSQGTAILVEKPGKLKKFSHNGRIDYYAVQKKRLASLPVFIHNQTINLGTFSHYCLLREKGNL